MKSELLALCYVAAVACALAGCTKPETKVGEMCEAVIKSRLQTPATYKAAKISPYRDQISEKEYSTYLEDKESKERLEYYIDNLHRNTDRPIFITVFVEYDAQNTFGALVRNIAECEFVGTEKTADPNEFNVYMDGQTKGGYTSEELAALLNIKPKRFKTMDEVRSQLGIKPK